MIFLSGASRRNTILSLAFCLAMALSATTARAQSPRFQIGSSNTVTADPLVARPNEKPCTVPLFTNFEFAHFSQQNQTFSFAPPAGCPGPWQKVVMEANFSETSGQQFDRTASIFLGDVNIYFGTTPEPRHNLAPTWHIERDVTDYAKLFASPQSGTILLTNCTTDCPPPFNTTLTGVFTVSADIQFYPKEGPTNADDPGRPADMILPLTQLNNSGTVSEPTTLNTGADQLASTFTLPKNIERAYLDVITQSQIGDEFWYSCVPNDVANELVTCGGTAFREGEVSIDGTPGGVAPVYPWVYTGGVDPFFWEPVPGVQTLNFVPFRVDLTPFAGLLSNGQPHTVALSVFNANGFFSAAATLLVYQDHHSSQVTGAITANTIGTPNPSITENLQTDSSGTTTGSVKTTSSRNFRVAGFVNTSHGRIETEVHQTVNFNNVQNFVVNATTDKQDITQGTDVHSETVTRQGPIPFVAVEDFHYPFVLNFNFSQLPDGSFTQLGKASQEFKHDLLTPFFASAVDNKVATTDLLDISAQGSITGNSGQKGSQTFTQFDTRGANYNCSIAATDNALTSFSSGCTADQPH